MEITSDKVDSATIGACLALRFLFHPKQQQASRNQLPDLSDSAIFHRLWDLFGLLDPETRSRLNAAETEALATFLQRYNSLPWEPLAGHPHISQLRDDNLSSLTSAGKSLHDQLIRRQNISVWKRLSLKLRGW
jgi:hypothetical protein